MTGRKGWVNGWVAERMAWRWNVRRTEKWNLSLSVEVWDLLVIQLYVCGAVTAPVICFLRPCNLALTLLIFSFMPQETSPPKFAQEGRERLHRSLLPALLQLSAYLQTQSLETSSRNAQWKGGNTFPCFCLFFAPCLCLFYFCSGVTVIFLPPWFLCWDLWIEAL